MPSPALKKRLGDRGDEHQGSIWESCGVCSGRRGLRGQSQAIKNRLSRAVFHRSPSFWLGLHLWRVRYRSDSLNPEMADHLLQLAAQTCQFHTRFGRLVTGGGGLFRHVPYVHHAAVDLFRHGALLLGSGGDLLVHRLDRRHGAGDVLQ